MSEALRADAIEPIAALIQRHAEIDDELERRGANDLLRERDHVRDLLKDAMVRADTIEAIDEVSGCCATIKPTFSDTFPDISALMDALPRAEMIQECLDTVVKREVVAGWIREGLVSRSKLIASGALVPVLRSRPLYVSLVPRKENRE